MKKNIKHRKKMGSQMPTIWPNWIPSRNPVIESDPWSKTIPRGVDVPNHSFMYVTCSPGLLSVDVIQGLVDQNGGSHQIAFPISQVLLVVSSENENDVDSDQNQ